MKLMELRGLLRKPGNPTMVVDLGNGVPMTIAFQKTPLLEALGTAFNDERTAETGLSYDPETNLLKVDGFVGAEPAGGTADLGWSSEVSDDMAGDDLDDEDPSYIAEADGGDPIDDEDDDLL